MTSNFDPSTFRTYESEAATSSQKRNVLMVAFHFPPDNTSTGVLRTLKFSRDLLGLGWKAHVLTVDPRVYSQRDPALSQQIPPDVSVTRIPCHDAKERWNIAGRYPGVLGVPDRFGSWRRPAVRAGITRINTEAISAIYSTYPVPSAHLIGLQLKRRSGLPWVADFRDPWAGGGGKTWRDRVDVWLERQVVTNADCVIANTEASREDFLARYPQLPPEHFVTITNGYDESDFSDLPAPATDRFRVIYPGGINQSSRDPTPVLRAMGTLLRAGRLPRDQTRLSLLGCGPAGEQRWLRERLASEELAELTEVHPERVPYRDSLKILATAGLLVVLNETTGDTHENLAYAALMVPAKVYEYLRLGRPFLALCGAGATQRLLAQISQGATCAASDEAGICAYIERAFAIWQQGAPSTVPSDAVTAFERRHLAARLAMEFDRVCPPQP